MRSGDLDKKNETFLEEAAFRLMVEPSPSPSEWTTSSGSPRSIASGDSTFILTQFGSSLPPSPTKLNFEKKRRYSTGNSTVLVHPPKLVENKDFLNSPELLSKRERSYPIEFPQSEPAPKEDLVGEGELLISQALFSILTPDIMAHSSSPSVSPSPAKKKLVGEGELLIPKALHSKLLPDRFTTPSSSPPNDSPSPSVSSSPSVSPSPAKKRLKKKSIPGTPSTPRTPNTNRRTSITVVGEPLGIISDPLEIKKAGFTAFRCDPETTGAFNSSATIKNWACMLGKKEGDKITMVVPKKEQNNTKDFFANFELKAYQSKSINDPKDIQAYLDLGDSVQERKEKLRMFFEVFQGQIAPMPESSPGVFTQKADKYADLSYVVLLTEAGPKAFFVISNHVVASSMAKYVIAYGEGYLVDGPEGENILSLNDASGAYKGEDKEGSFARAIHEAFGDKVVLKHKANITLKEGEPYKPHVFDKHPQYSNENSQSTYLPLVTSVSVLGLLGVGFSSAAEAEIPVSKRSNLSRPM